jgi:hypothetical protein
MSNQTYDQEPQRLTAAQKAMLRRLADDRICAAYLNKRVLTALKEKQLVTNGGTIGYSWVCLTSRGRMVLEGMMR